MVGAGIDDERRVGERVGVLPGLSVREREEDDVVPGEDLGRRVLQRQVRERAQVRLVLDERLSRVRVRGDGADLDVGMCGEDPEDLAARIAGCAGDGDRICHGFHLRVWGRWARGRRRPRQPFTEGAQGRLESASAQTSARGNDARSERRESLGGRRHAPTIAAGPRHPQIERRRGTNRSPRVRALGASASEAASSSGGREQSRAQAGSSRSRPRVALVGEGALERLAEGAQAPAGRAVGGVRAGRETRHVAREATAAATAAPPSARPRGPSSQSSSASTTCPVCPAVSRASASSSPSGSVSPMAFATPCQRSRAARDDEVGEVVDVDHLRVRAPRRGREHRLAPREREAPDPVAEPVGGVARVRRSGRAGRSPRGRRDLRGRMPRPPTSRDRSRTPRPAPRARAARPISSAPTLVVRGVHRERRDVRPVPGARRRARRRRRRRTRGWTRCRRPRPSRGPRRAS